MSSTKLEQLPWPALNELRGESKANQFPTALPYAQGTRLRASVSHKNN